MTSNQLITNNKQPPDYSGGDESFADLLDSFQKISMNSPCDSINAKILQRLYPDLIHKFQIASMNE